MKSAEYSSCLCFFAHRRTKRFDWLLYSFIRSQTTFSTFRRIICMNQYHSLVPKVNTLGTRRPHGLRWLHNLYNDSATPVIINNTSKELIFKCILVFTELNYFGQCSATIISLHQTSRGNLGIFQSPISAIIFAYNRFLRVLLNTDCL